MIGELTCLAHLITLIGPIKDGFYNRSFPHRLRWLKVCLKFSLVNLVVHRSGGLCSVRSSARANLCLQLCNLRFALRTPSKLCFRMPLDSTCDWAIGPPPNREISRVDAMTLPKCRLSKQGWMKCKIWTANAFLCA